MTFQLWFWSYLIAASESISLSGNLSFAASQNVEELMFISSGPFKISEGSSLTLAEILLVLDPLIQLR